MSDTSTPRKVSLELLEEIAAAFNSRDCDRIASYFTEDATFLTSGGTSPEGTRVSGKQAIRDYLAARFERIPDMRWEKLYEYVAGDDKAVSVWRVKGVSEDGTLRAILFSFPHISATVWNRRPRLKKRSGSRYFIPEHSEP